MTQDILSEYFGTFTDRDWEHDTDGTVRFAMVGVGWWTREEAIPAVAATEHCETTTLVSSSTQKAVSVANESDTIEHALTYDEFHAGDAADAYDAVYIATPNALHLPYVETAAELGKAVLCEKPMEVSLERGRAMIEACDAANVPLMVAYRMQTDPAVRRARELVRSGFVGEPVSVHGNMSQRLLQEVVPDPDQWRLNEELSGGATVMDLGIYPLNTARFVLDADPIGVQATTRSTHDEFDDVPDEYAAFQIEFPDDVLAACTASQNAYLSGHLHVIGTEGEFRLEPTFFNREDSTLELAREGTTAEVEFESIDQMEEEFAYFADCLLTDREIHPDGHHGLVDMEAMKAIYEAGSSESSVLL